MSRKDPTAYGVRVAVVPIEEVSRCCALPIEEKRRTVRAGVNGLAVYTALAAHADKQGHCWPSLGTLAKVCHLSKSTVAKTLSRLQGAGLILREQQRDAHGDFANTRYLLLPVQQGCTHSALPTLSASPEVVRTADNGLSARRT